MATTKTSNTNTDATEKIYKFKSQNKFLTVSAVDVQFIDGVATTTKLEVAKYLATLDGVEKVEE